MSSQLSCLVAYLRIFRLFIKGNDETLEKDMAKGDNENSRLLMFPQALSNAQ